MDYKAKIADCIGAATEIAPEEISSLLETPPDASLGDVALPCFKLSRRLKKAPQAIAAELTNISFPAFVSQAKAEGAYLNLFYDRGVFAAETVNEVLAAGQSYGAGEPGKGTVCVDFSSINIAKPFHIGHLSSTVIGAALCRIYKHLGYETVGINFLGDWGTQFGKLIVAYKKWGDKESVERGTVNALMELYVRFHEEAEKDPSLEDEARQWFRRIEDGDAEAVSLHAWFRELTLKEASKVYDMLGVTFDSFDGESYYNDKMDRVIRELEEKGLLIESEGARVVNLDAYGLQPCIIVKSDGATLYATRDIAAALDRKERYDFVKCLYVVAYQQNLHFKQWFKVVELMGYPWAKDLEHVAFGMVSLADGTLSTRKGKVILLKDVLDKAIEKTYSIIMQKTPDIENAHDIARQVGVGAVVFNTLYSNRIKDIVFSYDDVLNFDGETGPYTQYTHARCCSVLAKAGAGAFEGADCSLLANNEENAVIKLLYSFPEALREAENRNEPSIVTRHIVGLAQAYNKFYYEHRIIDEKNPEQTKARLSLTSAVKTVLGLGLSLIGLAAPEKM